MIFFPGEGQNRVETEASWPRERHRGQLRSHLQGGQVQDQEAGGRRPLQDILNHLSLSSPADLLLLF